MAEKTHLPCPHPDCKSSDAFSFNDELRVGYCHSCNRPWVERPESISLPDIEYTYEDFRGIPSSVREFYDSPVGYLGTSKVAVSYTYPHGHKIRILPKDFSRNTGFSNDHLFGMNKFQAGASKVLTIVEGEEDCMAAYHMLGGKWPVVSLPSASISKNLLKECHDYISSFENVVICTDSDTAGDRAATQLSTVFPNKVYRVKLTKYKDANDYLLNDAKKDFVYAWVNRQKYVPDNTYNTMEQFKSILRDEESNTYIPIPLSTFNERCKGIMQGHLTVITGPEGQGKTEILRMLEYHILKNYKDKPIAVLHMEESKKIALLGYACYELGKNVRDPDTDVSPEEVEAAIKGLIGGENLYLFEMGVDDDPLSIIDRVRYYAKVCGCKFIFIDPIQQLAYSHDGSLTVEQTLTRISVQLERIATEFDVGIIMTTHVNDEGQTRDSRMIAKSASVRIDLTRDHMNPDPEVSNITTLSVSKNRPTGSTGYAGKLRFDPMSFTLEEADVF